MSAENFDHPTTTTGSAPQVAPGAAQDEEIDDEALAGVNGGGIIGRLFRTSEKAVELLHKHS